MSKNWLGINEVIGYKKITNFTNRMYVINQEKVKSDKWENEVRKHTEQKIIFINS